MNYLRLFIVLFLSIVFHHSAVAQTTAESDMTMSFEEFLAYVKLHHPIAKQAQLRLSEGEANLLKARGGFDPKIEVDYDRKKFKDIEYYDQLNATFKIPTWYGIELKANFEENTGEFLNPNLNVPDGGLYSAGVSFSLAQGLLINERMATLKKARFFKEQTEAERDLLINDLLFEASKAYFNWLEATREQEIYGSFVSNAQVRLEATKRSIILGDKAAIDSVEAGIIVENRLLNFEAAKLKRRKAALVTSNFLWLNNVPLELRENIAPTAVQEENLVNIPNVELDTEESDIINNHPKIRTLEYKMRGLEVDRSLKMNKLLPQINLQYNFLSTQYDVANSFNTANYKAALTMQFPLFLRKERGDLKLARLKLQETNFELLLTSLSLNNKVQAIESEIVSLQTQNGLVKNIVQNYTKLVEAEERKFFLGESSLFLINARERSLIDARLKENKLDIQRLTAQMNLYNVQGVLNL